MLVHIQNVQINWLDYVGDNVNGDDDNVLSACRDRKGKDDSGLLHRGLGEGIKLYEFLFVVSSKYERQIPVGV